MSAADFSANNGRYCPVPFSDIEKRVWSRIDKSSNTRGCWEWTGYCHSWGYGQISIKHKTYAMHRLMYEQFKGPIPDGLFICHACDNPKCCNPDHLWAGTQKENIQDCVRKGRKAHPALTHCSRGHELTPENTYSYKNTVSRWRDRAQCRTCAIRRAAERRQRRMESHG